MPIFDQGYQHWSGHLSGHAWRWLAITRQGVRTGWKNKWVRRALFLAWLPAILLIVMICVWGLVERKSESISVIANWLSGMFGIEVLSNPKQHRVEIWTIFFDLFMGAESWFAMILVLLVGPRLISQDLRFNALPLYFSRPLRRIDYFAGKLGIIAAFIGMVTVVPAAIAYVLGLLFSLDISIVADTFPILLAAVAYGIVIALSAGTLILALSSLSRNSRYIPLLWFALWFVSGFVSFTLEQVQDAELRSAAYAKMMSNQSGGMTRYDWQAMMQHLDDEKILAGKTDWRPLVSYRHNLTRIGSQLLGTDAAWDGLMKLLPPAGRNMFRASITAPQFPWTWSAGVLIVLFGISVCILNLRIKSLDRLK
jgi:ABC-2 type transport system permease protein